MDKVIQKKKWTTKRIIILLLIVLIPSAIVYAVLGADYSSKLNVEGERIQIATVEKGNFAEYITLDGTIVPLESIRLDAVEGGVVQEIMVEDGAMLKKGDTILTLSNGNLQLDYINRETQILELLNQIETSRLNLKQNQLRQRNELADLTYKLQESDRLYEMNKKLKEGNAISQSEYQKAENELAYLKQKIKIAREALRQDSMLAQAQIRQMDQSVKRMSQNLEMVKENLQNLVVTAPMAGQLTSFDLKKGQLIQKGQNIGQIDGEEGFKVRVAADEHYISRIYTGQSGESSLNGKEYTLHVSRINPQVNNGFFATDMVFEGEAPENLKKGQNVSVKLALGTESKALLLKRGSFAQTTGGTWAYVLMPGSGTAERREITVGRQNPLYFEVLDGLQEGDRVVVSSYANYEGKDKLVIQ